MEDQWVLKQYPDDDQPPAAGGAAAGGEGGEGGPSAPASAAKAAKAKKGEAGGKELSAYQQRRQEIEKNRVELDKAQVGGVGAGGCVWRGAV